MCSNPDNQSGINSFRDRQYVDGHNSRRVEVLLRRLIISRKVESCCQSITTLSSIHGNTFLATERIQLMRAFLPSIVEMWQLLAAQLLVALSGVLSSPGTTMETLLAVALQLRALACAIRMLREDAHDGLRQLAADLDSRVLVMVGEHEMQQTNYCIKSIMAGLLLVHLVESSICDDKSPLRLPCDSDQAPCPVSPISILAFSRAIHCVYLVDVHVSYCSEFSPTLASSYVMDLLCFQLVGHSVAQAADICLAGCQQRRWRLGESFAGIY